MASFPQLPDNIKTRKEINLEIHLMCLDNGEHYKTPGSLTSKYEMFRDLIDTLYRLINYSGFTREEKIAFEKMIQMTMVQQTYVPFSWALKRAKYGEALRLAIKNPKLVIMFINNFPYMAKYFWAVLRVGRVRIK